MPRKRLYKIGKRISEVWIKVSPIHSIYVAQYGNPKGNPILHIHGGPGGSSSPKNTKFYNPDLYRIILYDQRGCGKSIPVGETKENTTNDLLADIETIRIHLGIDKWIVSGGSWGATMALLYSEANVDRVKALIVRGVYTARKFETEWLTKEGAGYFFPEAWEKYINYIPEKDRGNLNEAYAKLVTTGTIESQMRAAKNAFDYADSVSNLIPIVPNPRAMPTFEDLINAKIFYHYELKNSFLTGEEILDNAYKLKNIPGAIIHGRYDMICPPVTAYELSKAWGPKCELSFVVSGHNYRTPEFWKKILEYTDKFGDL